MPNLHHEWTALIIYRASQSNSNNLSGFLYRYISRAGMVGCCSGYPGTVKQAELKWAEKGSRGESINSIMISRSGGPMTPPIGTK